AIVVLGVGSSIAATGPVVAVRFGLAIGERPRPLPHAGMALALAGVGLPAFDRRPAQPGRRLVPGARLALIAALAFGLFLVAIRFASRPDAVWGVLATRAGSVSALLLLGIAFRSRIKFRPPDLPALFAV